MANGDTKTNQYLDIAANGTRADLPSDTCCETRTQTLIRGVAERVMDVEDEVERLENNPDVADIVATYADLQAYDTSQLTDKDVIRVLQDETHDGDSTYYRWSTATNTWTYIGESKQYTNFVGTDGTTAGEAGLVPAPAITDAGKFLKADGTWGTVESGNFVYRKLTSADYNWNNTTFSTDNPNCIAVWLLPSGVYYAGNSTEMGGTDKVRVSRYSSAFDAQGYVYEVYHDNSGAAEIYQWYRADAKYIRFFATNVNGTNLSGTSQNGAVIQTTDTLLTGRGNGTSGITQEGASSLVYADPTAGTRIKMGASASLVSGNSNVATAIGNRAKATAANSIAISGNKDYDATASGATSVMIGRGTASGVGSVAIGMASATGMNSICISATNTSASNSYATALNGNASGLASVAIGNESSATAQGSVALGANSSATTTGVVAIGSTNANLGYNSSNYRLLTGVYDPQSDHDAATKGYVDAAIAALEARIAALEGN